MFNMKKSMSVNAAKFFFLIRSWLVSVQLLLNVFNFPIHLYSNHYKNHVPTYKRL